MQVMVPVTMGTSLESLLSLGSPARLVPHFPSSLFAEKIFILLLIRNGVAGWREEGVFEAHHVQRRDRTDG